MKKWVDILETVEITNNRVRPFKGERRYLATGDLIGEEINDGVVSVDYESKPSRADLLVNEGDIIVARMQATNKVLLIDKNTKDLIVSTGFLTLEPQENYDSNFLAHYFRSGIFQREKNKYCSGATQKAINNGSFSKLRVPGYPLDEQKKIAKILDRADALRQKRKQSLQLLDDFLRAMFLEMFGDPVENQKKLDVVCLGDLCEEIKYGTNAKGFSTPTSESIPVIRIPNVSNGRINFDDLKYVVVDKAERERLLLRHGDLLFVRTNGNPEYIGRCAVFEENRECINASYLIRARLKKHSPVIAGFIRDVISFPSYRSKVQREARTTAGNYNINTQGLRGLKILRPLIDEQRRFEKISHRVSAIRLNMNTSLGELDNQFNALTQGYFG